ncbi:hypothetical protein [Streptomyces sp. S.PB5]|uniref:hypothetical protein n=1 Tax=Streptomyces sp. S.PB5 TaxID=3020844 RepID=UPI0025B00C80|nr:hypothetical protein [Streptomyces sp. S.PB5]MDN3025166.1 hypothetical protein [Streptomyces sp. S.PB5]
MSSHLRSCSGLPGTPIRPAFQGVARSDTIADSLKAIDDCDKAVLDGDTDPDSSRIDAAADELKDVCTS